MQNAETVLSVLRERGRRGLPLDELYRQLFNQQLYLLAYGRIYSNKGAMTPGPDAETADGMTLGKIERIIDALRHERYRFKPVRRHYIPKKDGKQRPLGLPSWSDKLVGEVVRLLLEAYYEPQFSDHSHGYRPGRGCHTALRDVAVAWTGTTWFIEGDISRCFDQLDHSVMLATLEEKIHDNRLLRLIGQMLRAGYLQDWVWNATLSGAPQGGVLSPCLSNIYLDRLDRFVETVLMPGYTRGVLRSSAGKRTRACAPNPQTLRPQPARTARPARMGANHGAAATQDPRGLRSLPRQHPREANRVKHGIVAGEPGDQKWSRRVREGGLGKGPQGTSPRPYLSRFTGDKARAVKARHVGLCRGGAYTQPRNGKGDAYRHWNRYRPGAIARRWTEQVVLDAMRDWQTRYGRLPSSYDWSRTHARRRGGQALRRLAGGEWPSSAVGTALFGTWGIARQAAAAGQTNR